MGKIEEAYRNVKHNLTVVKPGGKSSQSRGMWSGVACMSDSATVSMDIVRLKQFREYGMNGSYVFRESGG